MTTTVQGIEGLRERVGEHLGYSDHLQVTQERVDEFAEATGDFQWIHVDVERATREGPFGAPIAHGYLTLALGPVLLPQVLEVEGVAAGLDDGTEKVRFPAPVVVGSKVRLGVELADVTDLADAPGGARARFRFTFEVEGGDKPACVAEVLVRYVA